MSLKCSHCVEKMGVIRGDRVVSHCKLLDRDLAPKEASGEILPEGCIFTCKTCDHIRYPGNEGHCYMFRERPDDYCMQHTLVQAVIKNNPTLRTIQKAYTLSYMP